MGFVSNALATAVALVALLVARKWDARENFIFNISVLMHPYLMPFESVLGRPREEQIEIFQEGRKAMEAAASATEKGPQWVFRYFYGAALEDAVFGPNATRVASFSVESSSDPENYSVPITCTCPHDAGMQSNLPVVLYFHSGGMIFGSVKSELYLARYVASKANVAVCSIEYRLAPEHRYPAALEDMADAAMALLQPGNGEKNNPAAEALGVSLDVSTFVTWGFSAGGYMSAHAARHLAHYNEKTAALQVSLVPMAKPYGGTNSWIENWFDPFWSGVLNSYAWSVYLEGDDGSLSMDWRVSLLIDPPEETVARLPHAYVQINTRDGLRDEGEMYANRLREQGKLVGLEEFDATHVGGVPPFFNKGTPREGAYDHAISVLISRLGRRTTNL